MSSSVHNMRPGHKPALKGLASLAIAALLALALLLLLTDTPHAVGAGTIRYVDPAGTGTNCTNIATDVCTLDTALLVADDGDELRLIAGSYSSSSPIIKSLLIVGGYDASYTASTPDTVQSIIQGGSSALIYHGITNTVGTTLTLHGLYIENPSGRGIEIAPSSVVTQPIVRLELDQVWLQNNNAGG